jgi:rubredoxin
MKEYKCTKCGWVHVAIPRTVAEKSIADGNAYARTQGDNRVMTIDRYLRCFRCGAPSTGFIPAKPGDAPLGSTIQAVVVPGAEV